MSLVKAKVGFPFVKGINTKSSEKAQAVGELRDCVNFTVNKIGRLDPRKGFRRHSRDIADVGDGGGGTINNAIAMASKGDELLLFGKETAYSKTSDEKWVEVGKCLNMRAESKPINKDLQATSGNVSYGISGDYEYCVWAEQPYSQDGVGDQFGTGSWVVYKYLVRDRSTSATVIPPTEIGTMYPGFTYDGEASWLNNATEITLTGYPESELSIGDFVVLSGSKRLVTAVSSSSITISESISTAGSMSVVSVYKSSGQDALYYSPRIRVLCPVGTNHVLVLTQSGNDIKYHYANTGNGTHGDLELTDEGSVPGVDLGVLKPVWDADWFLSTNSSVTDSDGAAFALLSYESESPYGDNDTGVWLRLFNIASDGAISSYSSARITGGGYLPKTGYRRDGYVGGTGNNTWNWQPFLRVAHDESGGVPQASGDSSIIFGYTRINVGSGNDTVCSVYSYDDGAALNWTNDLFTPSNVGNGIGDNWGLARAGVGYSSSEIYVMAELHSAESASAKEPPRHAIVSSKFRRSDGVNSSSDEKALWSNASVHSDGIAPYAGSCYFWVTAAQGIDPTNAITFLADMDGRIHGHGVQGASSICYSLEHEQQAGESDPGKWYDHVQRNMSCLASRVTPNRWYTSGSLKFLVGSSQVSPGARFNDYQMVQPALLVYDLEPARPFRHQEANDSLYFCGGLLWSYDGSRLVESDFLLYPELVGEDNTTGTLPTGDYSYYAVYEFRDDSGALHVSRPAGPYLVTTGSHNAANMTIRLNQITNYRFTGKSGNPANYTLSIYRTNTDGSQHFLHKTITFDDWGDGFAPTDSSGDRIVSISYTDNDPTQHSAKDTDVLVFDVIGAANSGAPVSSPIDITRHKDSLLVSNTENVLYASMGLSNVVAPVFPQVLGEDASRYGMKADGSDSPITHIETNGQACVFFTKDNGYGFGGDGPNMFGEGQWSRPEKIAPGQGVRSDGFIASTPLGVIYSSYSGIALVTKELQLGNIGGPVDEFAFSPSANDPVVLDSTSEVWIPLSGDNGRVVLIYNYLNKSWYRHEIGNSTFHPGSNIEAVRHVTSSGVETVYLADSSGYVYRQKNDTDSDPCIDRVGASGTQYPITSELSTSWLQVPGYGVKARCYRIAVLGTWLGGDGETTLSVKTSTNFNNSSTNETHTATVTPSGIGEESISNGSSQVVVKPKSQKMESIAVKISTSTDSTNDNVAGWSLEGLLLEIGKRPDSTRFKLGATKTVEAT